MDAAHFVVNAAPPAGTENPSGGTSVNAVLPEPEISPAAPSGVRAELGKRR